MVKRVVLSCVLLFSIQVSKCQVGIGTTSPDQSSVLDVKSADKGILFPRMTTSQINAIVSPAKGLMVYNTSLECIQVNTGTSVSPEWNCISANTSSSTVGSNCNANGFEGTYVNGIALTAANKFSLTIENNSFETANINFAIGDLVLSGVSGISVNSVSPTSATIASGSSQIVEYELTGTPASTGTLTGAWTKLGLNCTKTVNVASGDATFTLPQTAIVVSINDGTPLVDIQGVVDNGSNQLTVRIPYTGGTGTYDAFTGTYVPNNAGTAEGGDANSFRLTYPSGTFSASGSIIATIEVDGDGSFDAEKQLFGVQETIATMDFQVNGNSKGNVNLDVIGGILDREFADTDHKFIYAPVVAADGNTWLNQNLGANYANVNHVSFNPAKKATAHNDFNAFGSFYQWGRYSDGHELINWTDSTVGTAVNTTTATNASSNTPGHNMFITEGGFPFDWRSPQNTGLWQGEAGVNNPCPTGYRLPTDTELSALISVEGITDYTTAVNSALTLSSPGLRIHNSGALINSGTSGSYWTSTVNGTSSRDGGFTNSSTSVSTSVRARGQSVRCIQD